MFKLDIEQSKKIVKLTASGFLQTEELQKVYSAMKCELEKFGRKQCVVLMNVSAMRPTDPDGLPLVQKIQEISVEYGRKVATVHSSNLTKMQTERLSKEKGIDESIKRFSTEAEALAYLNES